MACAIMFFRSTESFICRFDRVKFSLRRFIETDINTRKTNFQSVIKLGGNAKC